MAAFRRRGVLKKTAPVRARVCAVQVEDSRRPLGDDDACAQRHLTTSQRAEQINFRLCEFSPWLGTNYALIGKIKLQYNAFIFLSPLFADVQSDYGGTACQPILNEH